MMELLKQNLQNQDESDAGKKDSDSESSSDEKLGENEEKLPEITVEDVIQKFNLTIKDEDLKTLNSISKNKIRRSESAAMWLEMQAKKWKNLVINESINLSLI